MARVLPVPAPARINTGPSCISTAWRCSGFNSSRSFSMGSVAFEKVAHAMVADHNDARKLACAKQFAGGECDQEVQPGLTNARGLPPPGLAEINLEEHQAVVFFESDDVGNVQMGAAEQIELVLQVEIEQTLYGAVRRNDAGSNSRLTQFLLEFHPFLVAAYLWTADGDGEPAPAQILHAWRQD